MLPPKRKVLHELVHQAVGPIVNLQGPLSVASPVGLLGTDVETSKWTLASLHSAFDEPADESNRFQRLHHRSATSFYIRKDTRIHAFTSRSDWSIVSKIFADRQLT